MKHAKVHLLINPARRVIGTIKTRHQMYVQQGMISRLNADRNRMWFGLALLPANTRSMKLKKF